MPDDVANNGYYHVQGWFDNAGDGSLAIIVNVGASASASDYIGSAVDGSGFRALDAVDDSMLVMAPGLPLQEAYLVHSALIDYTETTRADFGNTLSTSFSLISIPGEIAEAQKDEELAEADLISVSGSGPYVLNVQLGTDGLAATGIMEVSDFSTLSGAIVTVDGTALTEGVDWTAATDNDTTAASLASAIDGIASVTATSTAAVITITAASIGVAGNSITLASDNSDVDVPAATLTGGVDGDLDLSEIVPGMIVKNTADSFTAIITAVDDSADTITIATDPTTDFDADGKVSILLPSAITYKETVINNPSKVAAWYFNRGNVTSQAAAASPGDVIAVDLVGHVAGVIARIDANTSIGGPSHAPAGIQYAGIAGIQGLSLSISERLDGEPLRKNFINRITSFPGSGNIIFGGYTADSGTSPAFTADEQLIQVMRTLQFIKASLEPGLRPFLWENQDPVAQGRVSASILSFLRNNSYLFPRGLTEPQKFRVIAVEATQDELDLGLLRVRVQIRPNKAIRFIEVALEFPIPAS